VTFLHPHLDQDEQRMKRHAYLFWTGLAAAWIVLLALAVPAQAFAQGHDHSSGGAKASDINDLFTILFAISVPVFLLVEGLILYAIVRRLKPNQVPEQVEGNHPLEIGWTVFAFVIVAVVFALTYKALQSDYTVKAERGDQPRDLVVHVSAYMFNWDFEYFNGDGEATGVITTKTLTIPAGRHVYLDITSKDVQHSFWVPKLAGKVDAVPGKTNTLWLTADKPGTYLGNCAEYCGTSHYKMEIEVVALEPSAFDAWLAGQVAAASEFKPIGTDLESPLPPGKADLGAQRFADLGCSSCHAEKDGVGPALPRMAEGAEEREGYTVDQYLRESILVPCAYSVPGYECSIMPADYGTKLDAAGVADLIEYLKESEGE
jgi:cytochrome c oxidase subunit 2